MRVLLFSLFIAILCLITTQAFSTTYYVNGTTGNDTWDGLAEVWDGMHGPKKTIQAGVIAASSLDTIIVADGTYRGYGNRDIDFFEKSLALISENGPESCIIDCEGSETSKHRGFYLYRWSEGFNAVIEGFTIKNGYVSGNEKNGGAIYSEWGRITVRNCIIVGNTADCGGGVFSIAQLLIENCIVTGNSSQGYRAGGGGVFMSGGSIRGSVFTGNKSESEGGGISSGSGLEEAVVDSCVISGNFAGWGGGIYVGSIEGCYNRVSMSNLIVSGNRDYNYSGGIVSEAINTSLDSNIICHNYCSGIGGGGVMWSASIAYNNILYGNHPNQMAVFPWAGDPELYNCDIEGSWIGPGEGNIDEDPMFVGGGVGVWTAVGAFDADKYQVTFIDASASWQANELAGKLINPDTTQPLQFYIVSNTANTITAWADWQTIEGGGSWVTAGKQYQIYDYHLTSVSPCIDTGTNSAPNLPNYDLDGNHRVWFGNTSWTVDMGAYEFGSQPLKIKEMSLTTEGYIQLTWNSNVLPGATYTVMYSDDEYSVTMSWSVLQAGIPSGGSETSYIDTTAPTGACRYYKVLDEN
jgi:hypothetical protein